MHGCIETWSYGVDEDHSFGRGFMDEVRQLVGFLQ